MRDESDGIVQVVDLLHCAPLGDHPGVTLCPEDRPAGVSGASDAVWNRIRATSDGSQ